MRLRLFNKSTSEILSVVGNWHRAMMIASVVTQAKTMMVKFLVRTMWRAFAGRGMNGECDQVKRREALELEKSSWSDLPIDVVELIRWKLRYEDGVKLACVCKSWKDIVQSRMPIYPAGKAPLLTYVKSREEEGTSFHYYSLLLNKAFQHKSRFDLRGYEIISAIHGALLIYNHDKMQMRMVDPLGVYSVYFPSITSNISFNGTAIGMLNDSTYVVFLIDTSHENHVTVHLYDEPNWALNMVYDNGNEPFYLSSNPVFFDGRFYCLGSKGDRLGIFDVLQRTWSLYSVEFRNKYDDDDDDDDDIHCYYLVDWIETVMVVRVNNNGSGIHLFLLDREKMVWQETNDLHGRSLFLGSTLSVMSLPTAKKLQNRVFLPHFHQDVPRNVIVAARAYYPDCYYFWTLPRNRISSVDNDHAATTICCCNNFTAEESLYLGSTQNQKYSTIWFQPHYTGIIDDEKKKNRKRKRAGFLGLF